MTERPCEVILEIGGEGGSLTLFGIRSPQGWLFSRNVIDQSASFLDDPDLPCVNHDSGLVNSWADGLELMNQYPWHKLYPLAVHPEFRQIVYHAVTARYDLEGSENRYQLPRWKELCKIPCD